MTVSTPVLATKLFAPAGARSSSRAPGSPSGSDTTLEAGHRLTLVSAPAGFGKTTLLSDWLAGLDQRQADIGSGGSPSTTATTTWRASRPPGGRPAERRSRRRPRGPRVVVHRLDLRRPDRARQRHHRAGEQAPGKRWILVLDDYHAIAAAEVHDAVTFLLDHLPGHLHLLIATRADPPLPLARLRSRGQLTELRAADLRFTAAEAQEFLNEVMGLELTAADVRALDARTEGWVAGLQLAALSLRGIPERGAVDGLHRGVHRQQPVRHRLPRRRGSGPAIRRGPRLPAAHRRPRPLTGPLCDAVTGRADGARTLADLERGNLFVVPLDDHRSWYRYHHLFADVLRARLLAEQPGLVPGLHERAADWYAAHGLVVDAVRHAIAAEDFGRAGYLIEEALPQMRRARQDSLLLAWSRSLPEPVVRRSPVLSILSAWSQMMSGDLDAAEARLDDAERALAAGAHDEDLAAGWADTEDLRTAPATDLGLPRLAGPGPRRRRRHRAPRPARPRPGRTRGPPRCAVRAAGSSAWPPGRPETSSRRCPHSARRSAACTPRATSSTSWTARSCSPTCGWPPAGPAAPAGCTSRRCRPPTGER